MSNALYCCALLPALALPLFASNTEIRQISIESRWGGLGKPSNTELTIKNDNGVYRVDGKEVNPALVQTFIATLQATGIPKPSLENLGLTRAWLESKSNDIVQNAKRKEGDDSTYWEIGAGSSRQKALFQSSYSSPAFIAKILPDLFLCCHTDDYPGVKVTITYADGSKSGVASTSQSDYMLPWKVDKDGQSSQTFDRNISIALVKLLPEGATNRERLIGDDFALALAGVVMDNIEDQWKLIHTEDLCGGALAQIRKSYILEKADVNVYHDVTFGVYSKRAVSGGVEENLHALVKKPAFSKGFSENAILLYKGGKVYGVDEFLQGANRYENLALSVPWLSSLRAEHPAWPITLLWVHDTSLSDKGMRQFANDMHRLSKDGLADEVRRVQKDVAVLNVSYGDWWLVLPDKRMILWRFESVSGLLGFKRSSFSPQQCSDYQGVTGGCVGAEVTPEGQLVR